MGELPTDFFKISSITLEELENIKTSRYKDDNVKFAARKITRELWENPQRYEVINYKEAIQEISNDEKILLCAKSDPEIDTIVTEDICFGNIAATSFKIERLSDSLSKKDKYLGYVEKELSDDELNDLYSQRNVNTQSLLENEYLLIKSEGILQDVLCWSNNRYRNLSYAPYESEYMEVSQKDIYQKMASDALEHTQFTMLTGQAGTAKTLLSLSYALSEIDRGRKNQLIIFCNPVPANHAAEIGFLKGDKNEKLLDSSIGNILASKVGGRDNVEKLINIKKLTLLTFADLRGYDTTGMNAIVLITEAQNLDSYLMQLAIQRIGKDCKLIVEGDYTTQVDSPVYGGVNNGMRRVSEVFRGYEDFAQVELKNIYRSGIAKKAIEMF